MKIKTSAVLFSLLLAGCGNLSQVENDGTSQNLVWPNIESATINHSGTQKGTWPNWENVRQIEAGMNKDQLYYLLGEPHFREGFFAVREWDYVFNYRENGEHKVCQFKILFDQDMNARSFFWKPQGCQQQEKERYELSADLLFDFNSAQLNAKGKDALNEMVKQLEQSQAQHIVVRGYTDRLGSDNYNHTLSQRRANAVKAYFLNQGVKTPIDAIGLGKAEQVVACREEQGQALKDCLRPNRRVTITTQ